MTQSPVPVAPAGSAQRLLSLDALRGFDMFWIVGAAALVTALGKLSDNAVTGFFSTQLHHVQWEGFHFYDLIFPLFVFIAGVSLVFSMERAVAQQGQAKAIARLARRCALLFLLGIFYYGGCNAHWPEIRLSGVLQYIAIASFCGGTLFILLRNARSLATVCAALMLGYWALMAFAPFPDVQLEKEALAKTVAQIKSSDPSKVLQAATRQVHGCYEEGHNLSCYIDYRYLPGKKINGAYESQPLLGCLGVISDCLLGILAGLWLRRSAADDRRKVVGLVLAGVASVALGYLWGLQFPVIKKLWSPSFVLVTAGCSALLLGIFYWMVEVWKWQTWCQPFVWIGMNPITIYLAHNIIEFPKLAARFAGGDVQAWLDMHLAKGVGGLLLAAVELSLTFLLVRFLYVRKIFIRL
jgi:predicted acyltransferase